jgi:hypothetical protein
VDFEHERRLTEAVDMAKSNKRRIEKLECENTVLHQLATSVAVMAEQLKGLNQNVTTLTGEVEEIKGKPAKRYDIFVTAAITGVVSAIIGLIVGLIF